MRSRRFIVALGQASLGHIHYDSIHNNFIPVTPVDNCTDHWLVPRWADAAHHTASSRTKTGSGDPGR
jgi:hypothetical protein